MKKLAAMILLCAVLGPSRTAGAQESASNGSRIGILPFIDATASGNRAAGSDVARTMLAEVVHSTTLQPRLLAADERSRATDGDPEKAIALGRTEHLDLIFVGTVLDARSEESNRSGRIPAFKGQSGSISIHRVKATVTLQGELYDVASGRRLFSERATGSNSNNALGGTAYTTFGAWGNDTYASFLESPMGRSLQSAIADMTKKIVAARTFEPARR
jgi:hypothetical protein